MRAALYIFPPQKSKFFAFSPANPAFKKSLKLILLLELITIYNRRL